MSASSSLNIYERFRSQYRPTLDIRICSSDSHPELIKRSWSDKGSIPRKFSVVDINQLIVGAQVRDYPSAPVPYHQIYCYELAFFDQKHKFFLSNIIDELQTRIRCDYYKRNQLYY